MIDRYEAATGPEAMLRFGPATGPAVVAALPLFEEANRTRAFVVTILRELAARGIAGALPDLPGQGESLVPLESVRLADLRAAFAAAARAAGGSVHVFAVRSGALLDGEAEVAGRWHLAPIDGASMVRELDRIRNTAVGSRALPSSARAELVEAPSFLPAGAKDGPLRLAGTAGRSGQASTGSGRAGREDGSVIEMAGNLVAPALLADLAEARPSPARSLRLDSDPAPADRHVPGSPLWRRAEPGNDLALATLLADDIASWVRACEG